MIRHLRLLACLSLLASCQQSPPAAQPHYVAGAAWQAEGVWHYPQDSLELNQTGIAMVYRNPPRLTSDGEIYDASILTAAQQTLALPAIARLTNLENGLQLTLRINDRGPVDPGRIVAVTPRVATLLQFGPDGRARVRLDVLTGESRAATEALPGGGGPKLDVGLAPIGVVQQTDLAPLSGARQAEGRRAAQIVNATTQEPAAPSALPQRLPETVSRVAADPGQISIELGTFSRQEFANLQRARLGGMNARIERVHHGRTTSFRVILGPYNIINDADTALRQAIATGAGDARIIVQ